MARDLTENARAPLESWQALRDAVRSSDADGADALSETVGAAERFAAALGERVLSRRDAHGYDGAGRRDPNVTVNIMTRDVQSFRQSRTQVAADIAGAVSLGRRRT